MDSVDSETDLYSFNVGGNSGTFVISNKDYEIVTMPHSSLKFEKYGEDDNIGFKVVDAAGITYYFFEPEFTRIRPDGSSGLYIYELTSWYLSKIVHPDGGDIILLKYHDVSS